MASARSVVSTDVGGARETVPPGGGAVLPAGSLTGLAAALVTRLRDPGLAAAEGRAGRDRVCAQHDLRGTAARVRELYEDMSLSRT
jgi:glycosyltransferase involved in cell wall biosynthesis